MLVVMNSAVLLLQSFFLKLIFSLWKAEQPLQDMELQEIEAQKD